MLRNNKFSQIDEIQIKVGSDANAIRNCVFVFFFAHISAFSSLQRNNEAFHSYDFTS